MNIKLLTACAIFMCLFVTSLAKEYAGKSENNKTDSNNKIIEQIQNPRQWGGWRTGPMNFPTYMSPPVPESLEAGPIVDFGNEGKDVVIVLPQLPLDDVHAEALSVTARWFKGRLKQAKTAKPDDLSKQDKQKHIIMLGTLENNHLAKKVLDSSGKVMMGSVPDGGYHIKVIDNPWSEDKKIILAMGKDLHGAWQASVITSFSIHASTHLGNVGTLQRWPVYLPGGFYWAPFEAKYTGWEEIQKCNKTKDTLKTKSPSVPFGIRCWGSPTPSIETFKRVIDALKPYGINGVVIQPGGWPYLINSGEVCKQAIDYAYCNGIFTWLYVGNELKAHLPAELTKGHRQMLMAVKDHTGLVGFKLYNQLTSDLSQEERQMIKDQIKWVKSNTSKPLGMEIVWGQNLTKIPPNKAGLMTDLNEWGLDDISHDYAPIGGWSKGHDLSWWEPRLKYLYKYEDKPIAILQGHVPFTGPTIPSRAELRNQFWWTVAGGAKAFFFEAAYIFNHFSIRGMLTWSLEPVPDGRLDEIGRLSKVVKKLEPMILTTRFATDEEAERMKIKLVSKIQDGNIRVLSAPGNIRYILLINSNLENIISLKFKLDEYSLLDVPVNILTGDKVRCNSDAIYEVLLGPGDGTALSCKLR